MQTSSRLPAREAWPGCCAIEAPLASLLRNKRRPVSRYLLGVSDALKRGFHLGGVEAVVETLSKRLPLTGMSGSCRRFSRAVTTPFSGQLHSLCLASVSRSRLFLIPVPRVVTAAARNGLGSPALGPRAQRGWEQNRAWWLNLWEVSAVFPFWRVRELTSASPRHFFLLLSSIGSPFGKFISP